MAINDRVKSVRLSVGLNQTDFGEKITVAQAYLSQIEKGDRDVTEKIFKLICLQFNVNEDWLRTGNGSMFRDDDSSTLARLASEYHLDGVSQTVLASFLSLNAKNREVVLAFVKETIAHVVTDNYDEIKPYLTGTSAPASAKTIEEEAAIEAEAYRQEYIQAKMRQISSASTNGNESTAG